MSGDGDWYGEDGPHPLPTWPLADLIRRQGDGRHGFEWVSGIDERRIVVVDDAGNPMDPAEARRAVERAIAQANRKPPGRPRTTAAAFQAREAEAREALRRRGIVRPSKKQVATEMGYEDPDSYGKQRTKLGLK